MTGTSGQTFLHCNYFESICIRVDPTHISQIMYDKTQNLINNLNSYSKTFGWASVFGSNIPYSPYIISPQILNSHGKISISYFIILKSKRERTLGSVWEDGNVEKGNDTILIWGK